MTLINKINKVKSNFPYRLFLGYHPGVKRALGNSALNLDYVTFFTGKVDPRQLRRGYGKTPEINAAIIELRKNGLTGEKLIPRVTEFAKDILNNLRPTISGRSLSLAYAYQNPIVKVKDPNSGNKVFSPILYFKGKEKETINVKKDLLTRWEDMNSKDRIKLFQTLDSCDRAELFQELGPQSRAELFQELDPQSRTKLCEELGERFLCKDRVKIFKELFEVLDSKGRVELFRVLDYGFTFMNLFMELDHEDRNKLFWALDSEGRVELFRRVYWKGDLFRALDSKGRAELLNLLNYESLSNLMRELNRTGPISLLFDSITPETSEDRKKIIKAIMAIDDLSTKEAIKDLVKKHWGIETK